MPASRLWRPLVVGLVLSFSNLSLSRTLQPVARSDLLSSNLLRRSSSTSNSDGINEYEANYDYNEIDRLCNNADNRQCWLKDQYNITSDYEYNFPKGVTREYWLEIDYANANLAPDGWPRDEPMKVINGTYPGPLIEANWGDELVIHVSSKLKESEGTTLHWHGVRQHNSTQSDGVNGVTQCPITTNYTYRFRATQYGHSWYHSHYALQYPDGVLGPLVIHGPTSANWDTLMGDILITDYYQKPAYKLFEGELVQDFAIANSTLINGHGIFPCYGSRDNPSCQNNDSKGSRYETTVERGKKYLLRLTNTGTATSFIFAIDNHMLEVVHVDFVPVEPYFVPYLPIAVGQRYEVIVHAEPNYTSPMGAEQPNDNFWIRTIPMDGCSGLEKGFPTFGILRYDESSTEDPTSREYVATDENQGEGIPTLCRDEPAENIVPIVPWTVGGPADDSVFDVGLHNKETHGFFRWDITDVPMYVNPGNPTILNLNNETFSPEYAVITDPHYSDSDWIYFVIQGAFNSSIKQSIPTAHPMHLHGHDFVILAQGDGAYNSSIPLNLDNPARRDVALLNSQGHLVIAFKSDNPGIWLLHCHIAWHASSGLALQIIERQNDIPATIQDLDNIENNCAKWNSDHALEVQGTSKDSGI